MRTTGMQGLVDLQHPWDSTRSKKYLSSSSALNTSTQAGDGLKNVLHGIRFGSKAVLEEWLGESLVDSIQTSLEICHIQQQGTRILVRQHSRFQHNLDCTRDLESSAELDAHSSSYFAKWDANDKINEIIMIWIHNPLANNRHTLLRLKGKVMQRSMIQRILVSMNIWLTKNCNEKTDEKEKLEKIAVLLGIWLKEKLVLN